MITVMGATGKTGGSIARRLLDAGQPVRALGRSERGLAALKSLGAETMAGDASDVAFLTDAFRGAGSIYTLSPYDPATPDYHVTQTRMGEAIIGAIHAAGVRRVVFLSSVGADLPAGTGFIASLHAQEQRLRQLTGVDVLVLRCGSFFENFLASLDLIRTAGINGDTVAPDVPIPMIATQDIAEVAARSLTTRDWSGFTVRELLGERDLSYAEATRIIGERIGQPDLPYVRFPDDELAAALRAAGFADDSVRGQLELNRALSDGTVVSREGRTPANTTPTRFEDYATELAAAFATVGIQ
jgi:uncharacterized protein YbjT (DUF2867 family)